ncbi:hypothetical protein LDENG_00222330 [Lucifuga dentata]|nr:hypothetical protein LDENG_00222330 [Lucifuga dentata]
MGQRPEELRGSLQPAQRETQTLLSPTSAGVVCRDSKTHTNHSFRPIDEAVQEHVEKLQKALQHFEEKLEHFRKVREKFDLTAEFIKTQSRDTETYIKEKFKEFHQFLQEEEEERLAALREEEEQKTQVMKEKTEALSREIEALSDVIRATKTELNAEDASFLNSYRAAEKRLRRPLLDEPKLQSGAMIDVAKHLGNLSFRVWDKMKEMVSYTPLVLDPNTACPGLILSEDLTSVTYGEHQRLPENPERFVNYIVVLASEGFDSGCHSWDVAVRTEADWGVGVMAESVQRTGQTLTGCWEFWFHEGKYIAFSTLAPDIVLPVKKRLQKIRVHLDWNRGRLSFSDPDTNTHLHTFTHTFTEKLLPFIDSVNLLPVKMSRVKVTAQLQQ